VQNVDPRTTTIVTTSGNAIDLDSIPQQQQQQQQEEEEGIAPETSTGESFWVPGSYGISQRRVC